MTVQKHLNMVNVTIALDWCPAQFLTASRLKKAQVNLPLRVFTQS
jgi:hypothetical protein